MSLLEALWPVRCSTAPHGRHRLGTVEEKFTDPDGRVTVRTWWRCVYCGVELELHSQ